MFVLEDAWTRLRRKSAEKAHERFRVNEQRQWHPNEPGEAEGIGLPPKGIFAQNDNYLEFCNPGWESQRVVVFLLMLMLPFFGLVIWMWCVLTLYPSIFGHMPSVIDADLSPPSIAEYLFGWLLLFPLAAASACMLFASFYYTGARSSFFTYLRGRVRFNRVTRKVYVLRPDYCGGSKVFDWDRLRALCDISGDQKRGIASLALYHPPFDAGDPEAKGEDCIFVGPAVTSLQTPPLWEYIRLYMQEGPTVDTIPVDAPTDYKQVPRYLPPAYTTYCGKPSWRQFQLEVRPGIGETMCHMLSQMTCSWPRFPKEWQSDSGLGEPEDRPVQTGAAMTALVYRAQGKLSPEDEVAFLRHWGTPEALAKAQARIQQ